MDRVIDYIVMITIGTGSYLLAPYAAITNSAANVFPQADRTNVQISTGSDRSSWTAYFTIFYTKT